MTDGFDFIIDVYGIDQAIGDGVLEEVFDNRCYYSQPTKRIVMTSAIAHSMSHATLQEVWDGYLSWLITAHLIPEEDRMYTFDFQGRKVWVLEDAVAITILFAEDY